MSGHKWFDDEEHSGNRAPKKLKRGDGEWRDKPSLAHRSELVSERQWQQEFYPGQEIEYTSTRRYAAEILSITDEEIHVKVDYGRHGIKNRTITKRQQMGNQTIQPADADTHIFMRDRRQFELERPQRGRSDLTQNQLKKIANENDLWVKHQEPQAVKEARKMVTTSNFTWYPQRPITEITIVNNDAISTAINAGRMRLGPTAIHNFASRNSPGGGYRRGIQAQEEDLCRSIPALESDLSEKQYPIAEAEVLVTRHAEIRRRMHQQTIESESLATVTILSSAMPNIRKYGWRGTEETYKQRLTQEIEALIWTATQEGIRTLITGAHGCGAFGNAPRDVASTFARVLKNRPYAKKLPRIIFAIIDTKGRDNIRIFHEELDPLMSQPYE